MTRSTTAALTALAALGALLCAAPAGAQVRGVTTVAPRRTATLPPARPAPATPPSRPAMPLVVLGDGSVVADFGRGYEGVIPSCASFVNRYQAGPASPPPQGGTTSPVPGANGLPRVPDLSPLPGSARASSPTRDGTGYSSLQPLHKGWRRVGSAYVAGVCWIQDGYGRLHLVHL